jgi:hypothetical protein
MFVISALGMEVDVCSGPLPAQEGLALLLRSAERAGERTPGAADHERGASARRPGRDDARRQPHSAVRVADWPVPMLALKCRQYTKRNVALAPGTIEALPVPEQSGRTAALGGFPISQNRSPDGPCCLRC